MGACTMYILAFIGAVALWILPVIYLWCVKPGKSIQDGLRDWLDESAEDI